ncbi:MAG: hypothetical protein KY439_00405 [Actinobacteria bacterium]|nr:hypothetical protein [Actinomycetota bacterium]
MLRLLLVLVVAMAVFVGICACTVAAFVHALTVRNRIVAGRPCLAPLGWLASPGGPARLHRRLRVAMAAANTALVGPRAEGLRLAEVVGELRERALEIDAQLVLASRSPQPTRRRMLRELHCEVAEVEELAQRVILLSRRPADPAAPPGLGAVRQRLELLESALGELDGVEVRLAPVEALPLRRQA